MYELIFCIALQQVRSMGSGFPVNIALRAYFIMTNCKLFAVQFIQFHSSLMSISTVNCPLNKKIHSIFQCFSDLTVINL